MSRKKYTLVQEPPLNISVANGTETKEKEALNQLKSQVQDILGAEHDDHNLIRWLKARNFDVDKAAEMFRASVIYKKKMGATKLLKNYKPPEVLQRYMAGGFCGYDKEGSPVLIELYGHNDMKGILYSAKRSEIEKTKLLMGETVMKMLEEQSKKVGKRVEGMTVVIDMDNVGSWVLWGPGIQMYAHMGRILQDNYPEIVKRTFIVNAPRIFPMLWKMFRPLVTDEMRKKVCILGGDYKEELLQHISSDQLPAFLGGDMTDKDGDPRCPSKICPGGEVPEKYYRTDLSNTDDYVTATIARGDKLEERRHVTILDSVLRWEFKTDGYDLGFGVFFENPDGLQEVLPVERVNSHMVPEDGTHTCGRKGTYVVVFDNSYSWTRGKTIYYNIDVVTPDEGVTSDLDGVTKGGSWLKISDETAVTKL